MFQAGPERSRTGTERRRCHGRPADDGVARPSPASGPATTPAEPLAAALVAAVAGLHGKARPSPTLAATRTGRGRRGPWPRWPLSSQPALHRPSGVEPAAYRRRLGRPGRHRAGPSPAAAMEPARRVGDLHPARPSGDRQRGRLHRRPGGQRSPWPSRPSDTPVSTGRAAGLRPVRAAAGIGLVQGQAPYRCRHGYTSATGPGPDGPRTCTSARIRSCPGWPPWPSC